MLRCVRTNRPVVPSKPAATIMAVRARSMSIAEDIASIPSVRQTPRRRPRGARLSDEDVPAAAERKALSTLKDTEKRRSESKIHHRMSFQYPKTVRKNPTVSSVQRKYRFSESARAARHGRGGARDCFEGETREVCVLFSARSRVRLSSAVRHLTPLRLRRTRTGSFLSRRAPRARRAPPRAFCAPSPSRRRRRRRRQRPPSPPSPPSPSSPRRPSLNLLPRPPPPESLPPR